jgi:Ca-activated chloride channel family protein
VRLLVPLTPVEPEHTWALRAIRAGGQTNLSGGWLKGLEQLQGVEGARKVLVLTDGPANVGISVTQTLVRLAAGARAEGVGTTTIGFGDGFNEDLLTGMADAGGGNNHYAKTADAAAAILAEEFDDLTRLAAQNVSVEIRPEPAVELLAVLNEYPQVSVPGGVQITIGDAYAGERRRIVFNLHVPALAELGVAKIAELVLRYVSVGEQVVQHELTIPIVVNRVCADEAAARAPDLQVREEVLVLSAARARDEAIRLADAGRIAAAQQLLSGTVQTLRSAGLPAQADLLETGSNSPPPPPAPTPRSCSCSCSSTTRCAKTTATTPSTTPRRRARTRTGSPARAPPSPTRSPATGLQRPCRRAPQRRSDHRRLL